MLLLEKCIDAWYQLEQRFVPNALRERDTLVTWRERALYLSFLCVVVFGFIALVPSLILSYQKGLILVFVLDIVVYVIASAFLVSSQVSFKSKCRITLSVMYFLGVILTISCQGYSDMLSLFKWHPRIYPM